jgi:hypothetical protein
MSNCFNCNSFNATFKRYVQTGKSTGKSNGNIYHNTYFGYKFFCELCAYNIDEKNLNAMIFKRMIVFALLIFGLLYLL